jgi:hypothetical protein
MGTGIWSGAVLVHWFKAILFRPVGLDDHIFLLTSRGWPGGHFLFLSRQEKEAKEGDRKTLPFGFPLAAGSGRETKTTRCAQTFFVSDPP